MRKPEKPTLATLFHHLGDKHFLSLLGAGTIRKNLETLINKDTLNEGDKRKIKQAVGSLKEIEKANNEADKLLKQLKTGVYAKLDPDSGLE